MGAQIVTSRAAHAVLFDLDGTLIDTAADLGGAANALREARGLPALPLLELRPWVSRGGKALIEVAFPGIDSEHAAALLPEFLQRYADSIATHSRAFDGVDALLHTLERSGLPWGIVTNKPIGLATTLLRALDLLDRCAVLLGGDSLPQRKPHPAQLLEACRRLDVAPAAAVYVGDDLRDVQAARAAAMPVLAAAWGFLAPGEDIADWGADAVVATPSFLLEHEPLRSWLRG